MKNPHPHVKPLDPQETQLSGLFPDLYPLLTGLVLTRVPRQLSGDPHISLTGLQAVDGANVVQASTGHVVPGGGIGACHHPG